MNWQQLVIDLLARGYTLTTLGTTLGMSKGHVHDLKKGRYADVLWERGEKLRKLHTKVMRRKSK
jgi:hypothetical protein